MATETPKAAKLAGLKITSRSENGFRRCGRAFGPDGTVLPLSFLKDAEVAALKAERQLIVVEVEMTAEEVAAFKQAEKASKKGEA